MPFSLPRAGLALAFLTATLPVAAAAEPYSVGLWGDMPYAKADDTPFIPALIADMNASDIAFSLYDGDIKDGSSQCTDDVFSKAAEMFNSLRRPVIYVPGDNEWTDCHRGNNGGYNNLERLDYLRKTMFATPQSFGQEKVALEHQGKPGEPYSENTRLSRDGAMFLGLNVPGSNNNKVNDEKSCTKKKSARTAADCEADNAEWKARDAANIAWLTESFAKAKAEGDKGIMIVLQADMGFDIPETEGDDESRLPGNDGYAAFLDALIAETGAYDGQVMLVHGDTHYFKMDKPLINATHLLPNFTRVQTFGSPNVDWLKVEVNTTSRDVFTIRPMVVEANATKSLSN